VRPTSSIFQLRKSQTMKGGWSNPAKGPLNMLAYWSYWICLSSTSGIVRAKGSTWPTGSSFDEISSVCARVEHTHIIYVRMYFIIFIYLLMEPGWIIITHQPENSWNKTAMWEWSPLDSSDVTVGPQIHPTKWFTTTWATSRIARLVNINLITLDYDILISYNILWL
jgi:hypothetical protein